MSFFNECALSLSLPRLVTSVPHISMPMNACCAPGSVFVRSSAVGAGNLRATEKIFSTRFYLKNTEFPLQIRRVVRVDHITARRISKKKKEDHGSRRLVRQFEES